LNRFVRYKFLWEQDRKQSLSVFLARNPDVTEFEQEIKYYDDLIVDIDHLPEIIPIGILTIFTGRQMISSCLDVSLFVSIACLEHIKFAFHQEIRSWIIDYIQVCNNKYRQESVEILQRIQQMDKNLTREIHDLEDIRLIMLTVKDLRENEIQLDMNITSIEQSYVIIQSHDVHVPQDDIDRADTLRYQWNKLQQCCVSSSFVRVSCRM
jgi:dynein heavy chain, axonemal